MKQLPLSRLERQDHLVNPYEFSDWTERSPVLSLMKDFRVHQPHTVHPDADAIEAARLMSMEGVTEKLVTDKDGELVGLLTRDELSEQRILIAQTALDVRRHELTVSDLMRPREDIPVVDYEALQGALVVDLVNTLRETGESHCLVLDRIEHQIRGLISVADIASRLHQPLAVKPKISIAQAVLS
ncbi:CBS domain-containing protein [Natronospirillum operosum]|uniref:CBS domain-containing protein n=1 Tax=Natronospirillum operosum TaxID=2759953 RepID=A0A4Z0WCW8_9GAMM|nr:CBS domain-containing protein [Natronospirillum operosum]TGG93943.1 CBS domain-containing protein [Natronospirillum operosum]